MVDVLELAKSVKENLEQGCSRPGVALSEFLKHVVDLNEVALRTEITTKHNLLKEKMQQVDHCARAFLLPLLTCVYM